MILKCKNIKLNLVLNKNIDISCIDSSHIKISEKHSSIIWRFIILKPLVVTIYKHSKNSLHITGVKSRESLNQIISFIMSFYQLPQLSIKNIFINNSLFSCKMKRKEKKIIYTKLFKHFQTNY